MTFADIIASEEYVSMVNDYRRTCLWFANDALHPADEIQLEQVLSSVERSGDLAGFKRAGRIRQWLSPHSNVMSLSSSHVRA